MGIRLSDNVRLWMSGINTTAEMTGARYEVHRATFNRYMTAFRMIKHYGPCVVVHQRRARSRAVLQSQVQETFFTKATARRPLERVVQVIKVCTRIWAYCAINCLYHELHIDR